MTDLESSLDARRGPTETRKRGAGFPQLDLSEAVDAVLRAGQYGAEHSQEAFATYLGHTTANSGAFRSKLASLRDWGLIETGSKDKVSLTGRAQELVLAAPEHAQEKLLLLGAFESCRIFGMLYNDSAKGFPLEPHKVRTTGVMRYGIASDQAEKFVDSFFASVVYAGLGTLEGGRLTLLPRESAFGSEPTEHGAERTGSADERDAPAGAGRGDTGTRTPRITASDAPTALRQAWAIDEGTLEFVIATSRPLPPEIYSLVAELATTAAKMVQLLSTTPEPTSESRTLSDLS